VGNDANELKSLSIDLHRTMSLIAAVELEMLRCPPGPACAAINRLSSISWSSTSIHSTPPRNGAFSPNVQRSGTGTVAAR
jgi:hypothetical protein